MNPRSSACSEPWMVLGWISCFSLFCCRPCQPGHFLWTKYNLSSIWMQWWCGTSTFLLSTCCSIEPQHGNVGFYSFDRKLFFMVKGFHIVWKKKCFVVGGSKCLVTCIFFCLLKMLPQHLKQIRVLMLSDKENLERTLFRLEQGNTALKQLCLQCSTLLDVWMYEGDLSTLYTEQYHREDSTAAATDMI